MNTIMKGCAQCRYCGKTIRFMRNANSVVAVNAESTAPEERDYDPKHHVAHRPLCPGFKQQSAIPVKKSPCINCGKKKKTA